jgi:hypothetical protein
MGPSISLLFVQLMDEVMKVLTQEMSFSTWIILSFLACVDLSTTYG